MRVETMRKNCKNNCKQVCKQKTKNQIAIFCHDQENKKEWHEQLLQNKKNSPFDLTMKP